MGSSVCMEIGLLISLYTTVTSTMCTQSNNHKYNTLNNTHAPELGSYVTPGGRYSAQYRSTCSDRERIAIAIEKHQ